jgi:hypothetical protein
MSQIFENSNNDVSINTSTNKKLTKRSYTKKIKPIEQQYNDDDTDDFDENLDPNDFSISSSTSHTNNNKKKRVLNRTQRVAANQRERKRMNIMNESFLNLRQALPISTGRKRRKMSRLDIVFGAMEYIAYLDSLLQKPSDGKLIEIDFDAYQNSLYNY